MKNTLVITGASRGIGKATAEHFIAQNWNVINLSRKPCELDGVINLSVDLMQIDWADKIADELTSHLNNADKICVTHNAGILLDDTVENLSEKSLRAVLELNVVAPSLLTRLCLPDMQKGSSIIYIGSTLSEKAIGNCASYVTSKHAVAGLMKATCQDLAGKGIHTCCVCPGVTDTDMLRSRANNDETLLDLFRAVSTEGRMIEPVEIAQVIWFAANNPVINGSVIHANLGQTEK